MSFAPFPGAKVSVAISGIRELQLDTLLGTGGFAQVWRVKDTASDKLYTLKVFQGIRPETVDAERIRMEAAVKIPSPFVVQPLGLHEFDTGTFLILFDYVSARPLDEMLEHKELNASEKRQIFTDLLAAVADAHTCNIIHRDLKPANILVTAEKRARLIDLGVAKFKEKALTVTNQILGTFEYMAPEQFQTATVDARTDIYALGQVLYEMAMGQGFWKKMGWNLTDYAEYMMQSPRPTMVMDLKDFHCDFFDQAGPTLERMCQIERENRYVSIREVQEALGLFRDVKPPSPIVKNLELCFPLLIVETGTNQGGQTPLNLQPSETQIYGRKDFAGGDTSISRQHLGFQKRSDGYYVQDCGSKNGTLLSGNALIPHGEFRPITHGDRIKIGDIFLRFVLSEKE